MPWKCPVCGYENADDALFCIRCGTQRPSEASSTPQVPPPPPVTINPQQQTPSQPQTPDQQVPPPPPVTVTPEQQASAQVPPPPVTVTPQQAPPEQQSTPQIPQPSAQVPPPPPPVTVNPQQQAQQVQASAQVPPPPAVPVQPEQSQAQQPAVQPPMPAPVPQAVQVPTQKYYILFINTPYSGLINQKIPLNFDIFPSISIGRSPENVIIVPDPEVSRRHAVLSLENGELYIEDLNSTNGTYVYDGKLFQPVKGKQKIQPNSIIKLGNQTIVKIVAE